MQTFQRTLYQLISVLTYTLNRDGSDKQLYCFIKQFLKVTITLKLQVACHQSHMDT